jgi:hypothetical protein
MHGRMDDIARARRHDRANARIKPTKNALTKVTARLTFSDIPSCTKTISGQRDFKHPPLKSPVRLTSIGLDARRNLSSPDIIKISDFLSKDGLKILLSYSFPINL